VEDSTGAGAHLPWGGPQGPPSPRRTPLTGEEIAEAELRAAWQATTNVIPIVPHHASVEPIKPLLEAEQL